MTELERKVEMIQRSAVRLVAGLKIQPRSTMWVIFMKREVQLCLDRLTELMELLEQVK
jgi:hypothetical protein